MNCSTDWMNDFGNRLKDLRKEKGLSQDGLCAKMKDSGVYITRTSIVRYEKGERIPDIVTLLGISNALDVSADYLLGRTDTPYINMDIAGICEKTQLSQDVAFALSDYNKWIDSFFQSDAYAFQYENELSAEKEVAISGWKRNESDIENNETEEMDYTDEDIEEKIKEGVKRRKDMLILKKSDISYCDYINFFSPDPILLNEFSFFAKILEDVCDKKKITSQKELHRYLESACPYLLEYENERLSMDYRIILKSLTYSITEKMRNHLLYDLYFYIKEKDLNEDEQFNAAYRAQEKIAAVREQLKVTYGDDNLIDQIILSKYTKE